MNIKVDEKSPNKYLRNILDDVKKLNTQNH